MTNRKTVSATDTEVVVKKRRKVSKEELLAQLKAEQEGQPENAVAAEVAGSLKTDNGAAEPPAEQAQPENDAAAEQAAQEAAEREAKRRARAVAHAC